MSLRRFFDDGSQDMFSLRSKEYIEMVSNFGDCFGREIISVLLRKKYGNISIFHGCMVWIEKSVTRVTDRHHEACRLMTNSDPELQIFLSTSYIHDNPFSCIPF